MHVVHKTRGFLSNWEKSGEAEWYAHPSSVSLFSNLPFLLSRKYLTQLHSTPTDTNAADALVTTYHTLLSATLSLWPSEHPISPPAFTAFVKSMFLSLPSSSQVASSPAATAFGELLIDTMWSIDSQLDDVIADSKAAIAAQSEKEKENERANTPSEDSGALPSRDAAMKDKGTLLELVKLFLVGYSLRMGRYLFFLTTLVFSCL
jgi:THO complex subunit 2